MPKISRRRRIGCPKKKRSFPKPTKTNSDLNPTNLNSDPKSTNSDCDCQQTHSDSYAKLTVSKFDPESTYSNCDQESVNIKLPYSEFLNDGSAVPQAEGNDIPPTELLPSHPSTSFDALSVSSFQNPCASTNTEWTSPGIFYSHASRTIMPKNSSTYCDDAASPLQRASCSVSLGHLFETLPWASRNINHLMEQHDSGIIFGSYVLGETSYSGSNTSRSSNLLATPFPGEDVSTIQQNGRDFSLLQNDFNSEKLADTVSRDGMPSHQQAQEVPSSAIYSSSLLLKQVCDKLLLFLSENWMPLVRGDNIHVAQCTSSKVLLIRRSLCIEPDGKIIASVHGKTLPPEHKFYQHLPLPNLSPETVNKFTQCLVSIWQSFRGMEICIGVPDYEPLWKTVKEVEVDRNLFQENRYNITLRHNRCGLLVDGLHVKRCGACGQMANVLRQRIKRPKTESPPKSQSNKYLNSPQKDEKLKMQAMELRKTKRENRRLKEKVRKLVGEEGVEVGDDVTEDFIEL